MKRIDRKPDRFDDVFIRLESMLKLRPLVFLGVGSELRSDDAWPLYFLDCIKNYIRGSNIHFLWGASVPENLIKNIIKIKPKTVIICDCGDMGLDPGSFRILKPDEILNEGPFSHRMSLGMLSKILEEDTGCSVSILLVQPKTLEFGNCISSIVKKRIDKFVDKIKRYF